MTDAGASVTDQRSRLIEIEDGSSDQTSRLRIPGHPTGSAIRQGPHGGRKVRPNPDPERLIIGSGQ